MDLEPVPGEFRTEFITRFLSDSGMVSKYSNSYLLRHAAERQWANRPDAPTVRSTWEKERRRAQMLREQR